MANPGGLRGRLEADLPERVFAAAENFLGIEVVLCLVHMHADLKLRVLKRQLRHRLVSEVSRAELLAVRGRFVLFHLSFLTLLILQE